MPLWVRECRSTIGHFYAYRYFPESWSSTPRAWGMKGEREHGRQSHDVRRQNLPCLHGRCPDDGDVLGVNRLLPRNWRRTCFCSTSFRDSSTPIRPGSTAGCTNSSSDQSERWLSFSIILCTNVSTRLPSSFRPLRTWHFSCKRNADSGICPTRDGEAVVLVAVAIISARWRYIDSRRPVDY